MCQTLRSVWNMISVYSWLVTKQKESAAAAQRTEEKSLHAFRDLAYPGQQIRFRWDKRFVTVGNSWPNALCLVSCSIVCAAAQLGMGHGTPRFECK